MIYFKYYLKVQFNFLRLYVRNALGVYVSVRMYVVNIYVRIRLYVKADVQCESRLYITGAYITVKIYLKGNYLETVYNKYLYEKRPM